MIQENWYFDIECSQHMIGNNCFLGGLIQPSMSVRTRGAVKEEELWELAP